MVIGGSLCVICASFAATFTQHRFQHQHVQQLQHSFTDFAFSNAPLVPSIVVAAHPQVRNSYLPPTSTNVNVPDKTYLPAEVPDRTYLPAVVPDRTYLPVKIPDKTYLPVPDKTYLPVPAPDKTYLPAVPDQTYLPVQPPPSQPNNVYLPANHGNLVDTAQPTDASAQSPEGLQPPLPGSPVPGPTPIVSTACLISCVG